MRYEPALKRPFQYGIHYLSGIHGIEQICPLKWNQLQHKVHIRLGLFWRKVGKTSPPCCIRILTNQLACSIWKSQMDFNKRDMIEFKQPKQLRPLIRVGHSRSQRYWNIKLRARATWLGNWQGSVCSLYQNRLRKEKLTVGTFSVAITNISIGGEKLFFKNQFKFRVTRGWG